MQKEDERRGSSSGSRSCNSTHTHHIHCRGYARRCGIQVHHHHQHQHHLQKKENRERKNGIALTSSLILTSLSPPFPSITRHGSNNKQQESLSHLFPHHCRFLISAARPSFCSPLTRVTPLTNTSETKRIQVSSRSDIDIDHHTSQTSHPPESRRQTAREE